MSLKRIIKSVLKEETYDLGERTNLEKMVTKLIDLKIGNIKKLDNFYGIAVDIFDAQYGKYCQIHFLMKEPFSRDDSDFIYSTNIGSLKSDINKNQIHMYGFRLIQGESDITKKFSMSPSGCLVKKDSEVPLVFF